MVTSLEGHGTRSEHVQRRVLYNKTPIPFELGHVISPLGEFKAGQVAPGKQGWQITSDRRVVKYKGVENIPEKHLKAGWYQAGFDPDLHTSWIYCVTYGYWIDPARLEDFVREVKAGKITLAEGK